MNTKTIIVVFSLLVNSFLLQAAITTTSTEPILVSHFDMELNESLNSVNELIANRLFTVENAKTNRENVAGAEGNALRFDGFSTYIRGRFNVTNLNNQALSTSIWCALESYPMMNIDGADKTATFLAGNMNAESGFAFTINAHGRYGVEMFINGLHLKCYAPEKFPKYEWVHLAAVISVNSKEIQLYKNFELIAKTSFQATELNPGAGQVYIGKSYDDVNRFVGPFRLNTINGLLDDFRIYSGEYDFASNKLQPENPADLSIPSIRFRDEIQRPIFHGMPGANWTNEPHGLLYHNNQYHLFFQKNGNGPYWGRIHWGHIVSDDLLVWKEEKTVIDPEDWYDIKGAWSGCVFSDPDLTNGQPHLFYTSADMGKTSMSEAMPLDNSLISWKKNDSNPLIPHRPEGLDEDFRDPYVFKANETFYMIVGTRKGGRGATTLHQYNPVLKTWSNDGRIFFQSPSADYGLFWEMPVIVPMNDNKWLFVVTPLGGKNGVETLYWVGAINSDGTFQPFSQLPREVEVGNMSTEGYGLLSPSIMQKDGKNIVIGIVPDKLGGDDNRKLGWAHTFSLPREWSLDSNNQLIQQPYEGLTALRNNAFTFNLNNQVLNGTQSLEPVSGKAVELEGVFTVSADTNQKFGFNVRKSGDQAVRIYYTPATNKITVDARNVPRLSNDGWSYNGLYESVLPETIAVGQQLKIHVFIDHSIMDIFLNNKWAFSIRIFPTNVDSDGIEVFSEGSSTLINSLKAWILKSTDSTSTPVIPLSEAADIYFSDDKLIYHGLPVDARLNVYDTSGRMIAGDVIPEHFSGVDLVEKRMYLFQVKGGEKSFTRKVMKN